MCQINPMSEIRAIAETCRRKCLPANARLLWRVLFDCANDRQERNPANNTYDWPEGFFPICNDELKSNSALEKRALLEARNILKEIGAIDFIPGENNRRPARYKIRYLTAGRYKKGPAHVPAPVPIYKDTEGEAEENSRMMDEEDYDAAHPDTRARARAAELIEKALEGENRGAEIRKGFVFAFGREPNAQELKMLIRESMRMGFRPEMVSLALEKASLYEPASPVNYAAEILKEWDREDVRLPHHVEQYEFEYRMMNGKYNGLRWEEQQDLIEIHKQRRRTENESWEPALPY